MPAPTCETASRRLRSPALASPLIRSHLFPPPFKSQKSLLQFSLSYAIIWKILWSLRGPGGNYEQKLPSGLRRERRPLLPEPPPGPERHRPGGGHLLPRLHPLPLGRQRRPGRRCHRHQPALHRPPGQILPRAVREGHLLLSEQSQLHRRRPGVLPAHGPGRRRQRRHLQPHLRRGPEEPPHALRRLRRLLLLRREPPHHPPLRPAHRRL